MIRIRALPVIGVLALAACADHPVVSPEASAPLELRGGSAVFAAQADGADTYIIQFKGDRLPADLDAAVAKAGGTLLFKHAATGLALVSNLSASGASILGARRDVEAFDADGYTELEDPMITTGKSDPLVDPTQAFFFPFQWNMVAVNAPDAWSRGKVGSPSVKVGVLDTGIDYLHPEFDGLIDLDLSASFVNDPAVPEGVLPIADFDFHGTHVASTIASRALLTAGVAANVKLVSLKVCTSLDLCPLGATLAAVLDAADKGLHVINLSLGGELKRKDAVIAPGVNLIKIIEKVFAYAHKRGTTVVVAAGNSAKDMSAARDTYHLFCDTRNVICVSATGPTSWTFSGAGYTDLVDVDAATGYTNFGRKIDVAAPGGSFRVVGGFLDIAWIFAACSGFVPGCEQRGFVVAGSIGTSMAAPHVAGLAALLAGELGRNPERIAARIRKTADDRGARGKDPLYGAGRINVGAALKHHGDDDEDSDDDSDSDSDRGRRR